jgi:hypothetical protein
VRNTIEARRWAESVDNHHGNHSRQHDDRGRGWRHDSDDDRDRSWLPNQRGPRAFGQCISDVKFPSRFRAPTNVPRYDRDTNPSIWLEDYRLSCHARGATNDLFVIKNLLLYPGDPHGHGLSTCRETRSTTGLTSAGSSSGTSKALTCALASSGSCISASSSR